MQQPKCFLPIAISVLQKSGLANSQDYERSKMNPTVSEWSVLRVTAEQQKAREKGELDGILKGDLGLELG